MVTEQLIAAILDKLNITKVLCIDDSYSMHIEPAHVLAQVAKLYPDHLEKCSDWFGRGPKITSLMDLSAVEQRVERYVATLADQAERRSLLLRLSRLVDESTPRENVEDPEVAIKDPEPGTVVSDDKLFADLQSGSALRDLMDRVRTVSSDKISFHEVSPESWTKDQEEWLKGLEAEHRCLILVDYDLKATSRTGLDLLGGLHNHKNVLSTLFSHDFNEQGERERAVSMADDSGLPYGTLFLLSKSRLHTDNAQKFAAGLKEVLLNFASQAFLDEFREVRAHAEKEAYRTLSSWSPFSLYYVVMELSGAEKIWEVYTLRRLLDTLRNRALRVLSESSGKWELLAQYLAKIRELHEFEPKLTAGIRPNEIRKIKRIELFEDEDTLNLLHTPLQLGDIFLAETGNSQKAYILLAQPCDLMLRDTRPKVVYLVPIVRQAISAENPLANADQQAASAQTTNPEGQLAAAVKEEAEQQLSQAEIRLAGCQKQLKNTKTSWANTKKELAYAKQQVVLQSQLVSLLDAGTRMVFRDFTDGETYYVDFKRAIQVPTIVLDLAVFRTDGCCTFTMAGSPPRAMIQAWQDRYKQVQQELQTLQNHLRTVEQVVEAESEIEPGALLALREVLLSPYKVDGELPSFERGEFKVRIRRKSHYREPWVSHMLKRFSDFLGRPAFEASIDVPNSTTAASGTQ